MPVEYQLPKDTAKVKGTISRETWHFEVTDASKIPLEFMTVDERAIGAMVRSRKGATNIPGVRVWSTTNVTARA